MQKILQKSILILLAFLLIFTSVAPSLTVFAEEDTSNVEIPEFIRKEISSPENTEQGVWEPSEGGEIISINSVEMSSIILYPGESAYIFRNDIKHPSLEDPEIVCYYYSFPMWSYQLTLTSLGGVLDYSYVVRGYGNLKDNDGNRIQDERTYYDWDFAQGGLTYQVHQTNSSLIYFDREFMNIENTSEYPMKLEWIQSGEHEDLIDDYSKNNRNVRDCGLMVEKQNLPTVKQYDIKPGQTYKFTRREQRSNDPHYNIIWVQPNITPSTILPVDMAAYRATEISGEGDLKFDIAIESFTYGTTYYGYPLPQVSNTPVVIPDARHRYGDMKYDKYFIPWTKTSDIKDQRSFQPEYIKSLTIKKYWRRYNNCYCTT